MKWAFAAAALVVVANSVVLVSVRRERSAPATIATIDVCPANLLGTRSSDEAPAIRLRLVADSPPVVPGLDAAGLKALGFSDPTAMAAGRLRDSTFHWPSPRPAWVRLGQPGDSLGSFTVLEVSPRREALSRDSTSLILHGLIGYRERWNEPAPPPAAGGAAHDHAAMVRGRNPGILYPAVIELIPSLLHLDRGQIAQLRAGLPDSAGCTVRHRVQIANGSAGGIWVQEVQ
jgi:hypothetical protein